MARYKYQNFADWHGRLTKEEKSVWGLLDNDRQEKTRNRVEALIAQARGEESVKTAAEHAGQSVSNFHVIRRKWREAASLKNVVPYLSRKSRSTSADDALAALSADAADDVAAAEIAAQAWRLVSSNPGETNGYIARLLVDNFPDSFSRHAATRIVQRVRREARMQPDRLRATYGTQIIVDMTAVAMMIGDTSHADTAIGHFVLERASGLVLGAAVGLRETALEDQHAAISRAISYLRETASDVALANIPIARLIVPDGAFEGPSPAELGNERRGKRTFAVDDAMIDLRYSGSRRFGTIMSVIGPRIHRLEFRPSSTLATSSAPKIRYGFFQEPVALEDAQAFVQGETEKWNVPIAKRLAEASIGSTASGSITAALLSVRKWTDDNTWR